MRHERAHGTHLTLRDMPFAQLVEADPDLADARRVSARKTPAQRRAAAEWTYDASIADRLFGDAISLVDPGRQGPEPIQDGVIALAIDPLYAPALLTVGSIEHQLGRPDAAMALFLTLTTLPADEPDLVVIVDKAGDFLLDAGDRDNALRLYEAAAATAPDTAAWWAGIGYCLSKLDRGEAAITAYRRAVELEPANAVWRNDLGWSLAEIGQLEAARELLEQALALSGDDYDLARGNLAEVEERMGRSSDTASPAS